MYVHYLHTRSTNRKQLPKNAICSHYTQFKDKQIKYHNIITAVIYSLVVIQSRISYLLLVLLVYILTAATSPASITTLILFLYEWMYYEIK